MTIRRLTVADAPALSGFTCARLLEPWAEVVQEVIRNDLANHLARGDLEAAGLFDDDGLCGVAAWRIYSATSPVLCRADIVAVTIGKQRQGYGRALKEAVMAEATLAGAAAVSSLVHRENTSMLVLNRQLGAVIEDIPDDVDYLRCVIALPRT